MPQSTLSLQRVLELLPRPLDAAQLEEVLFRSKAELADLTGDALKIEVTADRLDLLSEGGLGLHLAGATGAAHGLPPMPRGRSAEPLDILCSASVASLRPVISGVVLEAPQDAPLDDGLLAEAVRFQELLHATVGRDRRLASLGLYPLERLEGPVTYALEPLESVRFVPLDGTAEVGAREFFETHALAARYGAYGRTESACLTLRDAQGRILSLPPVLNARSSGEARPGDRRLLLESTGTLQGRVEDAVALLALVFVARGWRSSEVRVRGPEGGAVAGDPLRTRSIPLTEATLRAMAGEGLPANEVVHALGQARLSGRAGPGGWQVEVPPWRPDLLAEVDLVEEVLLARGLHVESGILPPTRTRGHRRPETRFRYRVGELLLGLGFTPLYSTVLVGGALVRQLGRTGAIEVANPVSELYSHLRDGLLVSLVGSLGRNVRHGYPQRLSEVGPVLLRDPEAEPGAATRYHAGVVLASESAGFADAAATVDYLLGALGTMGVREPLDLPGVIPGRGARVRLAGETVAELGEVHPAVLHELSIPVPVVWAELDLSRLWPLLARA